MADNVTIPATGVVIAADDLGGGIFVQRTKPTYGADGTAVDAAIDVGDSGAGVQRVVAANITTKVESSFNRPANTTAYTANDALANNTTAGSVTPLSFAIAGGSGNINRVRIRKSDQTVATPTIRLWLFDSSPTPGAGDNAAWAFPAASCLGYVDVDVTTAGSDDAAGWEPCDIPVDGATIYGLLETLSAFTPANGETFTVTLWYSQG